MKGILLGACLLLLAGCVTYAVQGSTDKGVNFQGVSTFHTTYPTAHGDLQVTTATGVSCIGKYSVNTHLASTKIDGNGTLKCSDGTTGTFCVGGTNLAGIAFGRLSDGTKFRFVFGSPGFRSPSAGSPAVAQMYLDPNPTYQPPHLPPVSPPPQATLMPQPHYLENWQQYNQFPSWMQPQQQSIPQGPTGSPVFNQWFWKQGPGSGN